MRPLCFLGSVFELPQLLLPSPIQVRVRVSVRVRVRVRVRVGVRAVG